MVELTKEAVELASCSWVLIFGFRLESVCWFDFSLLRSLAICFYFYFFIPTYIFRRLVLVVGLVLSFEF